MQKFNYHTHTKRCKHASGKDEEYILNAIAAGYTILGFSDHAPYRDYPSKTSRMDWEQLDEYIETMTMLKEKYKDQIEIHIGLETEYFPFVHEERVELKNKVEYLLLGQHFSNPDLDGISYFKDNTDEEILNYGKMVCEALDTKMFLYLAHPDVFLNRQQEFTKVCEDVAHMIAKKCVETSTPVEVNIRGVMKGKKQFNNGLYYYYPHKPFWQIMAQYPIKCIYGIDAHNPNDLLDQKSVKNGIEELADLNLQFITEPFKL